MSLNGIFPIEKWDFKSESILTALSPEDFELLTLNQTEQVYKKGEDHFSGRRLSVGDLLHHQRESKKI